MKGTVVITISSGDYDDEPLMSRKSTWRIEGDLSETNSPEYDIRRALRDLIKEYKAAPPTVVPTETKGEA